MKKGGSGGEGERKRAEEEDVKEIKDAVFKKKNKGGTWQLTASGKGVLYAPAEEEITYCAVVSHYISFRSL